MRYLVFFIIFSSSAPVWALDYFRFVKENCEVSEGLILKSSHDDVTILQRNGRLARIPQSDISFIVIYNVLENPIESIQWTDELAGIFRDFHLSEKSGGLVQGFAVKFIEGLVIIYDLQGKTHVVDISGIHRIRPGKPPASRRTSLSFRPNSFSLRGVQSGCRSLDNQSAGVIPTRVLGDKIQISEFLSDFFKGYSNLESFQERTYLYARPLLFEPNTRFGFLVPHKKMQNPSLLFPIYFRRSSGEAYRFQSETTFGALFSPMHNSIDPLLGIQSHVKSHFFHISFLGNLMALPAGTPFYSVNTDFVDNTKRQTRAVSTLNYMILMGVDYEAWSISGGFFYPTHAIQAGSDSREVLSSSLAPVFRLMYTGKKWKGQVLGSSVNLSENNSITSKKIRVGYDYQDPEDFIGEFKLTSQMIKLGVEYSWRPDLATGIDQFFLVGDYKEKTISDVQNSMDFSEISTRGWVSHRFGDYVRLEAYGAFYNVDRKATFSNEASKDQSGRIEFGGVFEFIL